MAAHAVLPPSSASRVVLCPASWREEQKHVDHPKDYTASGTLTHDLIDMAFADGIDVQTKLGKTFEVDGFTFTVDQKRIDNVKGYVAFIEEIGAGADVIMGETKVRYGPLVFGEDAVLKFPMTTPEGEAIVEVATEDLGFGRMDTAIVRQPKITIVDYKDGYTPVSPVENEQGMLYALGILYELAWMGDFTEVEIIIYQPNVGGEKPWSSWTVSYGKLLAFSRQFEKAALLALGLADREPEFNPGEKQCQFCRAKAHCPARREAVFEAVAGFAPATPDEFDQLPALIPTQVAVVAMDAVWLGKAMEHVDQIEDFCKAIRAEVERKLLQGEEVPGFKLVEGRLGNRNWTDPAEAEAQLKKFALKVDQMYDKTLISPTTAEKVLKKDKPSQWKKLQGLIHRAQGRPSVAPVSDQRPPLQLTATAEDFV